MAIIAVSCSTLSRNQVKTGHLTLKGGVHHSQSWSDRLTFKRYSWFKELSLIFDLLIAPIERKSPFYAWFSSSEKERLARCPQALLYLTYAQDSKKIGRNHFLQQMEEFGYSRMALTSFTRHLRMHPNYYDLGLKSYRVAGLCLDRVDTPFKGENIVIRFPGFYQTELHH